MSKETYRWSGDERAFCPYDFYNLHRHGFIQVFDQTMERWLHVGSFESTAFEEIVMVRRVGDTETHHTRVTKDVDRDMPKLRPCSQEERTSCEGCPHRYFPGFWPSTTRVSST